MNKKTWSPYISGALGEGRIDDKWGIIGMLFGGSIYALAYPFLKANVFSLGNFDKITLPQVLGVNHWIIIVVFIAIIMKLLCQRGVYEIQKRKGFIRDY